MATRGEALHHCATIGVRASGHREVTDAESLDSHTLVAGDCIHCGLRGVSGTGHTVAGGKADCLIRESIARCLRDSRRSTDGINASECDGLVCQRVTRRLSSGSGAADEVLARESDRRICEDVHGALGGASYRCDAIIGREGKLLICEAFQLAAHGGDGALSIHGGDVEIELLRECRHQRVQLGARALEALGIQRSEHIELRLWWKCLDIGLERVHVIGHNAGDDIGASLSGDALEHGFKLRGLLDTLARAIHGERRDSLSGDARQRRGELRQLLFAQP